MDDLVWCSYCSSHKSRDAFSYHAQAANGCQSYCKTCMVEYRISNRKKQRQYEKKHKSTPEGKKKVKARLAVKAAIEAGELRRPDNCEECGIAGFMEAHHDDHSNQLDVVWVCNDCHRKKKRGSKYNTNG